MKYFFATSALMLIACIAALPTLAEDEIRSERVQFKANTSGTTIKAKIKGRETVDYLLGARAGQTLSVTLETDHSANYFNVIPPDADNEAVFVGSTEGNNYSGKLDLDGDWTIRVYLIRAAARRGETATYTLNIGITGEPDSAAAREANDFGPREWDARGDLPCARGGQPMQNAACPFKVIRYRSEVETGATIYVLAPGTGTERILYFNNGEWSTDSAEPVQVNKRSDLWSLVVEDEAYEVPDAVMFGG
ncbi:MAG: hypothetical protein V2J55_22170 [Candidatus Competibacteraceae bacterium]|jgi:hypothetical protein|nr:hypothetical protein [Candidatus Competibacteraceae bacterium]